MTNRLPFDDMHGFSGWLQAAGAEVLPTTNRWEIIRIRAFGGVHVAYRNNKGRETWPQALTMLRDAYLAGKEAPNLNPDPPKQTRPIITIFADASFDHKTCAGGWACWIKPGPDAAITASAPIKSALTQSREAELCALVNALAVARLHDLLTSDRAAMLQSDCVHALALIRARIPDVEDRPAKDGLKIGSLRKPRTSEVEEAAIGLITDIVAATGIALITRHVRGHTAGDGRQWVNRQCDRLARAAMRVRQQEIQELSQ